MGVISLVYIYKQQKRMNDEFDMMYNSLDELEESIHAEIDIQENTISEISETLLRICIKQLMYDYSILQIHQDTLIETENFEEAALVQNDMQKIKTNIRIAITNLPPEEAEEYSSFLEN